MDTSPAHNRPQFYTASFYKFVGLPDHAQLQAPLQAMCQDHCVKGLVLLAPEGINGGLSGAAAGVQAVLNHLRQDRAWPTWYRKYLGLSTPPTPA